MLNTLYIRTFLAVVEAGNYTAAAEQLHMSQPAVSQHIRALEAQLGDVRLFRRMGQRMVPTHAGEELLNAARELIVLAERTEQNIRSLRGQIAGRVSIGCTSSSGEQLLPPLLTAFHERFPSVALAVQVAPNDMLLDALASRQVTMLLFEEQQRRRGWESHFLGQEALALLSPAHHPLTQQEQVPPAALREHAMILPCAGSPLRRSIEDGLRRRGVAVGDIPVALECDSVALTLQGVRDGLGLAFVPSTYLPQTADLGHVRLSSTHIQQEWYILRIRERGIPRAAQEFYTFLTSTEGLHILSACGLALPG